MYVLAGMLLLGLLCNLLIRPVDPKHHMTEEQLANERDASGARTSSSAGTAAANLTTDSASSGALLLLAWVAVAIPLAWGAWLTLSKALVFFK
jgi:hypothetical protein